MKCNKVKNPCKICFVPVTNKNGLKCQGACRKWAHFKCLNYTPGKIQDIKAGTIKITCPCPDCNTGVPKEILTDPPFTWSNTQSKQSPANKVPAVCSSVECPSHELYSRNCVPQKTTCGPTKPPCASPKPPCPPPISSCSPTVSPCPPPVAPSPSPRSPCPAARSSPPSKYSPCSPPKHPPCSPHKYPPSVSPKSPPSNPHTPPVPTKKSSSSCPLAYPSSYPSWQRARNAKKSFSSKQSQSCSNMSRESSCSGIQFDKMRSISSDSKLQTAGVDPKMLFAAIENICSTVGELSSQLRNLMCEIQTGYES